jgi:hypothetical protein
MYMLPASGLARSIRMAMPLVTFPIGCVAELGVPFKSCVWDQGARPCRCVAETPVGGDDVCQWCIGAVFGLPCFAKGTK